MKRRNLLVGTAAIASAAAIAGVTSYIRMGSMADYDEATARQREALSAAPDLRDLIRYGSLAANSHNTQAWNFVPGDAAIGIRPDFSRRTAVVDPDDHHLFVSLGCAAENIVQAASISGRAVKSVTPPAENGQITIEFEIAAAADNPLAKAIPHRQCTRSDYDGVAVSAENLGLFERTAQEDGTGVTIVTGKPEIEDILEQIIVANRAQIADPAFVAELKSWLRFNPAAAMNTGDGLFSACSGNPMLPSWLGGLMFGALFTESAETEKIAKQVRSSAGFVVFHSAGDDRQHWASIGRVYQRFALQAAALDIRHAHLNQPVEVKAARAEFAKSLGLGGRRPDLVVRFGHAPVMPYSMRRQLEEIIAPA